MILSTNRFASAFPPISFVALLTTTVGLVSCGNSGEEPSGRSSPAGTQVAELPKVTDEFTTLRREGDPALAPDMIETDSGLKYKVVTEGSGEKPTLGSIVRVHHTAWILREGKLHKRVAALDSRASHEIDTLLLAEQAPVSGTISAASGRGNPLAPAAPRPVVLEGWIEALSDMKKGERRWLIVPSALAYASTGYSDLIPADTDLVVDLQLVDFTVPRSR